MDLKKLVAVTKDGKFVFTKPNVHAKLVAEGLVEVNSEVVDKKGGVATRATQKLIDQIDALPPEAPRTEPLFEIVKNVGAPPLKKTEKACKFPFDQLEVGDGFKINEAGAAKKYASTVSSANARYEQKTEGTRTNRKGKVVPNTIRIREFVIRGCEGGAMVYRTK
jgi:hypothetical protein